MKLILMGLAVAAFTLSCKKKGCTNPAADNYDPEAEVADGSCVYPDTGGVRIWAAVAFPDAEESVTLINTSESSINIGGWTIGDDENPTAYAISDQSLASNATKTFMASEMGITINDSHETIYLRDDQGVQQDTWDN